jgi:HD-GYP domain-containing protein (c-di-GMP phosphodiesterase class II)
MAVFGLALGMREGDLLLLAQAGLLHDVGKSAIPFEILEKPGPLDRREWHMMRQHPRLSGEILRRNPAFAEDIVRAAENHHERLDGSGYPRALKGIEIDDLSLVCAITDVYGALTDKRAYKRRCSSGEAVEIMRTMTECHLEPSFFVRFEEMVRDGEII